MTDTIDPKIAQFLSAGSPTGKLGFTKADGQVIIVSVAFLLDGNDVVFTTATGSAKAKAFARDPRVAFFVDEYGPPPSWVRIEGVVAEDAASLDRLYRPILARYVPEERVETRIQQIADSLPESAGRVSLYRITPVKVRALLP